MKRETGWERWKDTPAAEGDLDGAIGGLFRKAGRAPAVSETRLRRIERRLLNAPAPRLWALPVLRWAIVGGVVLSAGGLTAGVIGPRRIYQWAVKIVKEVPSETPASDGEKRTRSGTRVRPANPATESSEAANPTTAPAVPATESAVPVEPAIPAAAPASLPSAPVRPLAPRPRNLAMAAPNEALRPPKVAKGMTPEQTPAVRSADLAPALAPEKRADQGASTGGAVAAEAEMVARALGRLRRDGDPAGALAALDEYERRFPTGTLRGDAALVRIDALLARNDVDAALKVADATPGLPLLRMRELQLVQAERLATSDCAAAVGRFDFLLRGAILPNALRERALYGRANCQVRTGNRAAAQRDLHAYLAEFPSGRFAPTVRRALRSLDAGD